MDIDAYSALFVSHFLLLIFACLFLCVFAFCCISLFLWNHAHLNFLTVLHPKAGSWHSLSFCLIDCLFEMRVVTCIPQPLSTPNLASHCHREVTAPPGKREITAKVIIPREKTEQKVIIPGIFCSVSVFLCIHFHYFVLLLVCSKLCQMVDVWQHWSNAPALIYWSVPRET